jgi:hypothetical protein
LTFDGCMRTPISLSCLMTRINITNISHFYCLMNFISTTMNVFTSLSPFSNMLDLLCQTIGSGGFRKLCAIMCFVGLLSCVLYEAYQAGRSFVLCCCRRLRIRLCRRVGAQIDLTLPFFLQRDCQLWTTCRLEGYCERPPYLLMPLHF